MAAKKAAKKQTSKNAKSAKLKTTKVAKRSSTSGSAKRATATVAVSLSNDLAAIRRKRFSA